MSGELERGAMGSVIVRVAGRGTFFATRDSARRLIAETTGSLPEREAVIFEWAGVEAVTGAFAAEFARWAFGTGRRVGVRGMSEDVRAEYDLACRRLLPGALPEPGDSTEVRESPAGVDFAGNRGAS